MINDMKEKSATEQIDDIIELYGGWKGEILSDLRGVIQKADPEVIEEVKWKMRTRPEGLPVWSHNGIVCMAETFKDNIKLVFPKGAQMEALKKSFSARLNSKTDRAIELHAGDVIDKVELTALIVEAKRLNIMKVEKH